MRSRTALTVAGCLLLAAAVVAGLLLAGGWSPTVRSAPEEPPREPVTTLPALADLPRGGAPQVIWARGRTLHVPGGSTVELGRRFLAFAPYGDNVLAIAPEGDGYRAVVLDARGRRLEAFGSALEVAASHDGSTVLYRRDDHLLLRDNRTGGSMPIPSQGEGTPVATAVDGGVAWFARRQPDGSQLSYQWSRGKVVLERSGTVTDGTRDGWRIRWTPKGDDGSCSDRVAPGGRSRGVTCEWTLDGYSPDVEHVLAGPAYRDGIGDRQLAILPNDAWSGRGRPVVDLTLKGPQAPYFLDTQWEDADSVLAIVAEPAGSRWTVQVVRIDVDGTIEAATDAADVPEGENPFVLGAD